MCVSGRKEMKSWLDRQEDRQDDRNFSTYNCSIFFLISVAKDTTSCYVSVVRSYNVALWDISLNLAEWRICLIITLWTPSDRPASAPHRRLIHSHRYGSPLPHLWFYLWRRIRAAAKILPLAASETFTQRRMQRIGAGSPHSKGSVNGATEWHQSRQFIRLCSFLWSHRRLQTALSDMQLYSSRPDNQTWYPDNICLIININ